MRGNYRRRISPSNSVCDQAVIKFPAEEKTIMKLYSMIGLLSMIFIVASAVPSNGNDTSTDHWASIQMEADSLTAVGVASPKPQSLNVVTPVAVMTLLAVSTVEG